MATPEIDAAIEADKLFERRMKALARAFKNMDGKAFEPAVPDHPIIVWAIEEGFMKRVDGRVFFEAMKDAMVKWTVAGEMAIQSWIDSKAEF